MNMAYRICECDFITPKDYECLNCGKPPYIINDKFGLNKTQQQNRLYYKKNLQKIREYNRNRYHNLSTNFSNK